MNFFCLVRVLGYSAGELIAFLDDVQETTGVRGFHLYNDSFKLLWLYNYFRAPADWESKAQWLNRIGLSSFAETEEQHRQVRDLGTCVAMMLNIGKPFWFTKHGIQRAPEWELLRTVSRLIHIPEQCKIEPVEKFESLYRSMGGVEVDEMFALNWPTPCDCDDDESELVLLGVEQTIDRLAKLMEAYYLAGRIEGNLNQFSIEDCREKLGATIEAYLKVVPLITWPIVADDIDAYIADSPQRLRDIVRLHQDLKLFNNDDSPVVYSQIAVIIRELSKKTGA